MRKAHSAAYWLVGLGAVAIDLHDKGGDLIRPDGFNESATFELPPSKDQAMARGLAKTVAEKYAATYGVGKTYVFYDGDSMDVFRDETPAALQGGTEFRFEGQAAGVKNAVDQFAADLVSAVREGAITVESGKAFLARAGLDTTGVFGIALEVAAKPDGGAAIMAAASAARADDENPFHPESPEGRAWDAGDKSSIS